MGKALTIDRYPREVHNRFAEDQVEFDPLLIEDSTFISHQTEVSVLDSVYIEESEALFGLACRGPTWAAFEEPPKFKGQSNRFFRQQIIREIDPEALSEVFYERLEEAKTAISEQESALPKKKLGELFETIETLNQLLSEVRARIQQYAKG